MEDESLAANLRDALRPFMAKDRPDGDVDGWTDDEVLKYAQALQTLIRQRRMPSPEWSEAFHQATELITAIASQISVLEWASQLLDQHHPNWQTEEALCDPFIDSSFLLAFTGLEALVNVVAELAVVASQTSDSFGQDTKPQALHPVEIEFLRERREEIREQKGRPIVGTSPVYLPLEQRMALVPALYARVFGEDFRLDKNHWEWARFKELKQLRDGITHPRLDSDVSSAAEQDLHDLMGCMGWYMSQLDQLPAFRDQQYDSIGWFSDVFLFTVHGIG